MTTTTAPAHRTFDHAARALHAHLHPTTQETAMTSTLAAADVDTAAFLAHTIHADRQVTDSRCPICRDRGAVRFTEADRKALVRQAITDMAVRIKVTDVRNTLTFATLFQAEQAADLFRQAGLPCNWLGGNQPVLTTAADFPAKGW